MRLEKEFTEFFANGYYESINVHDKLVSSLEEEYNKKDTIHILREPPYYDRTKLIQLTMDAFNIKDQELQQTFSKKKNVLDTKDTQSRAVEEKKNSNQEKNKKHDELQQVIKNSLAPEHKKCLDMKQELEKEQEKQKKQLTSEKKKAQNSLNKKNYEK